MSWNHRIVRHPVVDNKPHKEEYFSLRTVHYDDVGRPTGMSAIPTRFVSDDPEELIKNLELALGSARKHPVLDDPWPNEPDDEKIVNDLIPQPLLRVISRALAFAASRGRIDYDDEIKTLKALGLVVSKVGNNNKK